jgi:four helix bundle protein
MTLIRNFRDLEVWQKSLDLVINIYRQTGTFPREEQFGLTSQIRRAAVSIPANIAEGNGRIHRKEYRQFVSNAYGSLMELETHLIIAERLSYLGVEASKILLAQTAEVGRMLNGLKKALSNSDDSVKK